MGRLLALQVNSLVETVVCVSLKTNGATELEIVPTAKTNRPCSAVIICYYHIKPETI